MRITLELDTELLAEARRIAVAAGRSLSEVVEDALRATLPRRKSSRRGAQVQLTAFAGNGLRPGVDLDNSADLLDLMERLEGG